MEYQWSNAWTASSAENSSPDQDQTFEWKLFSSRSLLQPLRTWLKNHRYLFVLTARLWQTVEVHYQIYLLVVSHASGAKNLSILSFFLSLFHSLLTRTQTHLLCYTRVCVWLAHMNKNPSPSFVERPIQVSIVGTVLFLFSVSHTYPPSHFFHYLDANKLHPRIFLISFDKHLGLSDCYAVN